MFKQIRTNEMIGSEAFVKNAVDSTCNKIDKINSKRIILNSGRGTGKSLVLYNLEIQNIGKNTPFIYTSFDAIGLFHQFPNEIFNEKFLNHYYEVVFANKLLNYIKKYYAVIYETNFKDIECVLDFISKDTDNYINQALYRNINLNKYLTTGELCCEILKKFKKALNINSLSLGIDRFDWINGSSEYSQKILTKYFNLFDKVIITSDDITLDTEKQNTLLEKGYSLTEIDYCKDLEVVKEIIKKRIILYNRNIKNGNEYFNEDIITNEIYHMLVDKFEGNISLMLDCVGEVIDAWQWHEGNLFLLQQFDITCNKQLNDAKMLKKMYKSPTLYL